MSYLGSPRLVFTGLFQADVSTVNNDVRHYDNSNWDDSFQKVNEPTRPDGWTRYNGWWNPDGTGAFRLLDVGVVGAEGGGPTAAGDPALNLRVESNVDRPSAKLVDLDPQFQMGSMIWGLQIVFTDGTTEYLRGDFEPAPFRELFFGRIAGAAGSGSASARFTSLLTNLRWNADAPHSDLLAALKSSADANQGCLSLSLMTFGYDGNDENTTFTLGRVVGAIGPWTSGEPRSFVAGRRFAPGNGGSSALNIGYFDAVIEGGAVNLDLGTALPMSSPSGDLKDLGLLSLVVLKTPDSVVQKDGKIAVTPGIAEGAVVTEADYDLIGYLPPYSGPDWLMQTGGIVGIPIAEGLADELPLALLVTEAGVSRVEIRETIGGYFVRADDFEHRVDAVREGPVPVTATLRCTRFGRPVAATVQLLLAGADSTEGANGNPPTGTDPQELDPLPAVVPTINVPSSALRFNSSCIAGADGVATVSIQAFDPAGCRGYIDGQIFTITYAFGFTGESPLPMFDNIYLHVRDAYDPPEFPLWLSHVEPVLAQFGNLYPIMSRGLFSFSDSEVVAAHAGILMFALAKPMEDPNHMPVTRDMSAGKRRMLLNWLAEMAGQAPPPLPEALTLKSALVEEPLPEAAVGAPMPAAYGEISRMKTLPQELFSDAGPAAAAGSRPGRSSESE